MVKTQSIPHSLKKIISPERLLEVCQRNGVAKLYLFGSFLSGKATAKSDVDLVVRFKNANQISLLDLIKTQRDLRRILKKSVDLTTADSLSPYFRKDVLSSMQLIYEN